MRLVTKLRRYLRVLGPGLITGASDDDPSGIATYSQAGAAFGLATLWTALFTFPLMAGVQEMCARIGLVTRTGLAGTLKAHYPKSITYVMLILTFPAIILNIGADIQGMGAVSNMLVPQVPVFAFSIAFTAVLMWLIIKFPYQRIARILKWLCISLLTYFIVPFLIDTPWSSVAEHTFVPTIHWNKEYLAIFVGILGTTISPYLFFWQASMEAEDRAERPHQKVMNKRIIRNMIVDVDSGTFFSNAAMLFIILTTGIVLHDAGITQIDTVEQAAKALEPLAGRLAYVLFAIGVIGTGLLTIPVLSGALAYIAAETLGWSEGLNKKFHEARGFYLTMTVALIIGLSLNMLGISPIRALIFTAILYGVTAPVMIGVILHICNNKAIMGEFTNGRWSNILGTAALIVMSAAAVALLYLELF